MPKIMNLILPAVASLTLLSPAVAAPALWEVRDADSAIWLFGSFHVLPEELAWRTPLFDEIVSAADEVVFEANVGPAAIADIGAKAFAIGIYTDGTLLTDVIDDGSEAKLRSFASSVDLPVGSVLAMKPWFAANTLSVAAMAAQGFTAGGVEFVLQPELPAGKQAFLETGEEQLAVLAGAPEAEQIALLVSTLDEAETMPKVMDKMMSNWVKGTPDRLADLFLAEMGGFEDAFLDRLIFARNRDWIPALETRLAENTKAVVVVGAAHLIGEGSVLDLLETAGYTVKRVQ